MTTVRYVVLNENALGYISDAQPGVAGVLASTIDGPNPLNGPVALRDSHRLRPATAQDFDNFRVSSTGHLPAD
jgi:putative DNA primase/helicase